MSKQSAIHTAVWAQLAHDGKPYPSTGQETMSGTYDYTPITMPLFLRAVHDRLANDTPPFTFNWPALSIDTALADSPGDLCGDISDLTT